MYWDKSGTDMDGWMPILEPLLVSFDDHDEYDE
jgi:hypothetical protein